MHVAKLTFSLAKLLDNASGELIIYIDVSKLHRLQLLTVLIIVIENLCLADGELVALTAHVLDQNRQMKLTTTRYFEAVGAVGLFHTKADIGVQLSEQTIS